jgi:hypothetical protein
MTVGVQMEVCGFVVLGVLVEEVAEGLVVAASNARGVRGNAL